MHYNKIIFTITLIFTQITKAYIPIRNISDLRDPQNEDVAKINANVVVADYSAPICLDHFFQNYPIF